MPRKKTTVQFITDAHKVHGDRYDYSKVVYQNSTTKVCIICKQHGEFWQAPNYHLQGEGCPTCSGRKKKTQEEFIAQAKAIHGDRYGYDKVVYINDNTKVTLTCPIHGYFQTTPDRHIHAKAGCRLCANEENGKRQRLGREEFIKRGIALYGDKYSYDKVVYVNSHHRVTITCPVHGDFIQLPYQFLNGHGCQKCGREAANIKESLSLDDFIEKSKATHKIEYDYSKVELKGALTPVCIICPIHGEFWQTPNIHTRGCDCPKCAYQEVSRKKTKSLERFIEQARAVHGDLYDYSETIYENALKKVSIRCKKHNLIFKQKPAAHLNGNGCPLCCQSHLELVILKLLQSNSIRFEAEKTFDWLLYKGNMFLDFFLPDYSIAIECQGIQHFKQSDYYGGKEGFRITKERDQLKRSLCEKHGIVVLYFSDLDIKYPYPVIESKQVLLDAIYNRGKIDNSHLWKMPELPFVFED